MRASTPVLTGLSAAAVALLAACGGAGPTSDAAAAPTTASSTTSPGTAQSSVPAGDVAAWCDRAVALSTDLSTALTAAASDPSQVAPALQSASDTYADVTAPAPIAADWNTLVGAIRTLATAARDIDFSAPDAAARLSASISGQSDELNAATSNVEAFAGQNCSTPSAAPSS